MSHDPFFAASIDPHISVIDLHESTSIPDALDLMERALFRLAQEKKQYCRIIHGVGEGVLAVAVHRVLRKHPLVTDWQEAPDGGSCLVLFT